MLKAPPPLEHNEKIPFINPRSVSSPDPISSSATLFDFPASSVEMILLFTCQRQNGVSLCYTEWTRQHLCSLIRPMLSAYVSLLLVFYRKLAIIKWTKDPSIKLWLYWQVLWAFGVGGIEKPLGCWGYTLKRINCGAVPILFLCLRFVIKILCSTLHLCHIVSPSQSP